MSPAELVVIAALVLIALTYWPIGPWVRRRNARKDGVRESIWLHSHERGEQ